MKQLRVLMLTKYGPLGASSRMRAFQYLPWLEAAGLQVTVQTLLTDELLQSRYDNGGYRVTNLLMRYLDRFRSMMGRAHFDVLWIEKEALPLMPLWLELSFLHGIPYVLDYDDAIFHNYEYHHSAFVRRFFGRRLDGLMASSALVVGGNAYLVQRAADAGSPKVEIIPTVIDLDRYALIRGRVSLPDGLPRVVWIGSPATVHYLGVVESALRALAKRVPFVLRVIGGGGVQIPGVSVEVIAWTEATEVASIAAADVGIMPLVDSSWERGKCGYKLIQYMACGLPVVASPVGVNKEIVSSRVNGFLANTTDEWVEALEELLVNRDLRETMGAAGRRLVESVYCIQKTGPRVAQLLQEAAKEVTPCAD